MMIGKVYKLWRPDCKYCYIGSSYCKYTSVRMAHHRQAHRRETKDYKGLFSPEGGDPNMEILDQMEMPNGRDDAPKLRKLEEEYEQKTENTINDRRCYLSDEEKIQQRNIAIDKYHNTPLGKVSQRKGYLNHKLKKVSQFDGSLRKQIDNELKFLNDLQVALKVE